jgi:hypothetical protein
MFGKPQKTLIEESSPHLENNQLTANFEGATKPPKEVADTRLKITDH